MKAFIALAVVCLVAIPLASTLELSDEAKAKGKAHFHECVKQENVSEEDASRLSKKDFSKPSSSAKCLAACMLEKFAFLQDNKVQKEVVLAKLSPVLGKEKTEEVLSKCSDMAGTDRCATGYKIFECLKGLKVELI